MFVIYFVKRKIVCIIQITLIVDIVRLFFVDILQVHSSSSSLAKVHEVLSVSSLVSGSLSHPGVSGQSPASLVRSLVLLEPHRVGDLLRLVLHLLGGETDAHGDDGQPQETVERGEGHLDHLEEGHVSMKTGSRTVVSEAYCCQGDLK